MRGGRQLLLIAMLLFAAGVGMARTPDGPPEYEPVLDSRCWECHKPGAYDPDMDPYIALAVEPMDIGVGEEFRLPVQFINTWIAPKGGFSLYNFRITLDLSNATSLGFTSDKDMEPGGPFNGEIPIDLTRIAEAGYVTNPQTGSIKFDVPDGATTVLVTLTPDNTDANIGPDLTLNLYPGDSTEGDPLRVVNEAGKGATETFRADTPADFGELGYSNWTIEASTVLVDANGAAITPTAGDITFNVNYRAWFNASAEVQQVVSTDSSMLAGQQTLVGWDLQLRDTPRPGEELRFTVNMTAHYSHEGDEPDYWDFMEPMTFALTAGNDGGLSITPSDTPTLVEVGPQLSLARIGEVIGYISAILLIASVWTGGMFGKASRRQLNKIFGSARRRVAFHNFLSYGIIAFAIAHTFLFMWDVNGQLVDGFHWLVGLLWGGQGVLALLLLGVTGAIQVPMIRKWNYATWRWTHFGLAIAAIVFTVVHMVLDGQNFSDFQEWLGYTDPIVPDTN